MSAARELDNIQDKMNWHWRNSMRVVRFFAFDARAAFPVPIVLFNLVDWRSWFILFLTLMLFRFLENIGLTVPAAFRNFRAWVVGVERSGWYATQKRKFVDYG